MIARDACIHTCGSDPHNWPRDHNEGRWWVLHTKSRNEKALALQLCDFRINFFLPLVKMIRRYARRHVETQVPLFPGYLFAIYRSYDDRLRVLETRRVANNFEVTDQYRLTIELEHIRHALVAGDRLRLFPGIRMGRRCRILAGPLKGLEGVVVRRGKKGCIFLAVDILGQSATVDVDLSLVEPV